MDKMTFIQRTGGSRTFANDGERLIDAALQVIPSIPESQYTTDNKPRVEAIEALIGEQITEAQRDQAFKLHSGTSSTKKPAAANAVATGDSDHE